MQKIHIIALVLVLVIGGFFLLSKSSKLEAPSLENKDDGAGENSITIEGDNEQRSTPNVSKDQLPEVVLEEEMVKENGMPELPVKEFTVSGKNFSLTPNIINVQKGDKVKITFDNTGGFHDFKIDAYGLATKQGQAPFQETLEFTADKVGRFEYYCSVGSHRSMGMTGNLVVN